MKEITFTSKESEILCSFYINGMLSRNEEKALFLYLQNVNNLSIKEKQVYNLIKAERNLFLKKTKNHKKIWIYSSAAAVILAVCGITIPLVLRNDSHDNEQFVVWKNGVYITGDEAKKIAEENQESDMQMIRQIMKQHREMMKRNMATLDEEYEF